MSECLLSFLWSADADGALLAEVAELLEAPEQHDGEHGPVEDVAELALPAVRDQVVQVAIVLGEVPEFQSFQ